MAVQRFSRRRVLLGSGACATVAALAGAAVAADALRRTPTQVQGPFYPLEKPLDDDADLTLVKGRKARAQGQVVHVMGRVLNAAASPSAARASRSGRRMRTVATRIPRTTTRRRSIRISRVTRSCSPTPRAVTASRPSSRAAYPAGAFMRPAHIHFDVAGKLDRLVTQMYFPDDPLQ